MLKKYLTREVKIGFLAIASAAILYFGLNYLKGINIFVATNYYYAQFNQIDGIVETTPVFIQGHQVGQVRSVSYDFEKNPSFVLTLDILDDLKLPKGTKAVLFENGLLGGNAIRLEFAPSLGAYHNAGDTISSFTEMGMMAKVNKEILPQLTAVIVKVDSVMYFVNKAVKGNQLENGLNSFSNTASNLETATNSINVILDKDLPVILSNVNTITKDFKVLSGNVKDIDFAKTVTTIDKTMNELNAFSGKLNNSQGTVGLLLNDKSLYNNLSNASKSADSLLFDLKAHPKRYIHFSLFGSKEK